MRHASDGFVKFKNRPWISGQSGPAIEFNLWKGSDDPLIVLNVPWPQLDFFQAVVLDEALRSWRMKDWSTQSSCDLAQKSACEKNDPGGSGGSGSLVGKWVTAMYWLESGYKGFGPVSHWLILAFRIQSSIQIHLTYLWVQQKRNYCCSHVVGKHFCNTGLDILCIRTCY